MINWIWAGIMLVSIFAGAIFGRLDQVNNALLDGGKDTIVLSTTLGGAMCLWGGNAQDIRLRQRREGIFAVLFFPLLPLNV